MKRDEVEREWMGRVEVQVCLIADTMQVIEGKEVSPQAREIIARQLHRLIYDVVAMEALKWNQKEAQKVLQGMLDKLGR
jgi:hypothetical protein